MSYIFLHYRWSHLLSRWLHGQKQRYSLPSKTRSTSCFSLAPMCCMHFRMQYCILLSIYARRSVLIIFPIAVSPIRLNYRFLQQDFKRLMHSSSNSAVSTMWPEGKMKVTEVTKRPQTAGTIFKNSMIALTQNLASKVRKEIFFWLRFFIFASCSNP